MFHITVVGPLATSARYTSGFECLWVDFDADGALDRDERARAYVAKNVSVQRLHDGRRKLVFDIWVPRANEFQVCGRSYRTYLTPRPSRSRQESKAHSMRDSRWTSIYSHRACAAAIEHEPPEPPAEVPESSTVPMLAVTGGTTGAVVLGVTGWRRRRGRRR